MTDIESAIISALQADKNNFKKVLNDVARGYAACGFFEIGNWQEIVNSSFNSSSGASKEEVNGEKKLPENSQTKEEVSSVTLRPQKIAMENKSSSTRIVTRRSTVTIMKGVYNTRTAIVQPKTFASDGQPDATTKPPMKSRKKVLADSNMGSPKLSSRTLRSGSQQIFEA